jgi:DNA-directed RNA polymerase subunit F
MVGKKAIEERPVTISEVKEILEKSLAGKEESNYEQKTTLEHLHKFVKLDAQTAKKMVYELMKESDKIKINIAVKIADLLPEDESDVRAIFAKERFAITKKDIDTILKVVEKHTKKSR